MERLRPWQYWIANTTFAQTWKHWHLQCISFQSWSWQSKMKKLVLGKGWAITERSLFRKGVNNWQVAEFSLFGQTKIEMFFLHITDKAEEEIDIYITKPGILAATCDFGTITNFVIQDQTVCGMDFQHAGEIFRERSLTLSKRIQEAKSRGNFQKDDQSKSHECRPRAHSG